MEPARADRGGATWRRSSCSPPPPASSAAPGQGNYAAANAFLDALAQHGGAPGLPGRVAGLGAWAQASGMTGGAHRGRPRPDGARTACCALDDRRGHGPVRRGRSAGPGTRSCCPCGSILSAPAARRLPPLLRALVRPRGAPPPPAPRPPRARAAPAAAGAGPPSEQRTALLDLVTRPGRGRTRPRLRGRTLDPDRGLHGARLRLADRGRAAQPAQRGHRPAAARHRWCSTTRPRPLLAELPARTDPSGARVRPRPAAQADSTGLEALLAELARAGRPHPAAGTAAPVLAQARRRARTPRASPARGHLASATDDELFDFIDKDLGI